MKGLSPINLHYEGVSYVRNNYYQCCRGWSSAQGSTTRFSDENREVSKKEVKLKILAFAATNSRDSINKALISYAARLLADEEVEIIDINEYEMPLYSVDREREIGIPEQARRFYEKIEDADALLISFAEHNGFYTAAYKNLFDWTSRLDRKVYQDKPASCWQLLPALVVQVVFYGRQKNQHRFLVWMYKQTFLFPDSMRTSIWNMTLSTTLKYRNNSNWPSPS